MPTPITALQRGRIVSLDAFRGITFLVMLFVNCLAGARGIPYGIGHMAASVDGMSLADVVFPGFMFAVGMSIPFGINSRILKGDSAVRVAWHVGYRAFGLIVMGFFMVNTEQGYNAQAVGFSVELWALLFYAAVLLVWGVYRFPSRVLNGALRGAGVLLILWLGAIYRSGDDGAGWMSPEWWGILGCIGWTYLAASILYVATRGRVAALLAALAACVAFFVLHTRYDIGDVLSMHATHLSMVLAGLVCSLLFFDTHGDPAHAGNSFRKAAPRALLLVLGLALAAWLLHQLYPISKIGATPPWALYCAALCLALFTALHWLINVRHLSRWTAAVEPVAANPLVTYLIPIVLAAAMRYFHWHWPAPLGQGTGALLFAVVFAAAIAAIVAQLNKLNFKLKL